MVVPKVSGAFELRAVESGQYNQVATLFMLLKIAVLPMNLYFETWIILLPKSNITSKTKLCQITKCETNLSSTSIRK